jgi:hypothetical protein
MRTYPKLRQNLRESISRIVPSAVGGVNYYPVTALTIDSSRIDCVYMVEANQYYRQWGVWPEEDRQKRSVDINEVTTITISVKRLPWKFAEKVYDAGESGMGYHVFTIVFEDGTREIILAGGAVDFIDYSHGHSAEDVIDVIPHAGRGSPEMREAASYAWCLYSE